MTTLRSLAILISEAPEGCVPASGFHALVAGRRWRVRAILTRTAVLEDPDDSTAERQLAVFANVMVDPEQITWQPRPGARERASGKRGRQLSFRNRRGREAARG